MQPRDIFGNAVLLDKPKRISRKETAKVEILVENDEPIYPEIGHLMSLSEIKIFIHPKLDEIFLSRMISEIPNWKEIYSKVEAHLRAMPNFSVNQAIDYVRRKC